MQIVQRLIKNLYSKIIINNRWRRRANLLSCIIALYILDSRDNKNIKHHVKSPPHKHTNHSHSLGFHISCIHLMKANLPYKVKVNHQLPKPPTRVNNKVLPIYCLELSKTLSRSVLLYLLICLSYQYRGWDLCNWTINQWQISNQLTHQERIKVFNKWHHNQNLPLTHIIAVMQLQIKLRTTLRYLGSYRIY